jgi:hypothetical protein
MSDLQDIWTEGRASEIAFWRRVIATKGDRWPEDYANRINPDLSLQPWLCEYLPGDATEISIIDVGAGPLTCIGKKWIKPVNIVATDALADDYNTILHEYGVRPLVTTARCLSEELSVKFGVDRFDVAYARNTLDHSIDPLRCLAEMLSVVKKGGIVATEHSPNEAESQKYRGLHQWNLELRDGAFVCWRQDRAITIDRCFSDSIELLEARKVGAFIRHIMRKRVNGSVDVAEHYQ